MEISVLLLDNSSLMQLHDCTKNQQAKQLDYLTADCWTARQLSGLADLTKAAAAQGN